MLSSQVCTPRKRPSGTRGVSCLRYGTSSSHRPVDGVSQASQMLVLLTSHVWGARIRAPQIAADETTDEIVSAADKNAAADQRIIIKLCIHANQGKPLCCR